MQKLINSSIMSVLGFGLVITLAGCSRSKPVQEIEITTAPIEKPELVLPPVDEVRMRPVTWIIINEANLEEKIQELTANDKPLAMFVLSAEGYENLGLNISDIRALVQQQQQIIIAYKRYYGQVNKIIDEANRN